MAAKKKPAPKSMPMKNMPPSAMKGSMKKFPSNIPPKAGK